MALMERPPYIDVWPNTTVSSVKACFVCDVYFILFFFEFYIFFVY